MVGASVNTSLAEEPGLKAELPDGLANARTGGVKGTGVQAGKLSAPSGVSSLQLTVPSPSESRSHASLRALFIV